MKTIRFILIAYLVGSMFASCERIQDENENAPKSGMVSVKITDAPFPAEFVKEANVTINRVELKSAGNDENDDKKSAELLADSDTTIVISEEVQIYNLLDLSNGITALLAEKEIPEGEYNEIRLFITEASVVLDDNSVFDLKVSSGNSSGLKIKIRPSLFVYPNADNEILLDFDVSRSFKVKGNAKNKHGIKGFLFKPVVRAVNNSQTGTVFGTVTNPENGIISNALITLFSGTDTITTAQSSSKGNYAIIGIPEGNYTIECEHADYQKSALKEIEIVTKEKLKQDFVLLP